MKILDIAMNLNRIGNWAADSYEQKRKRIKLFLGQTSDYINSLTTEISSGSFQKTLTAFLSIYKQLEKEGINGPKDPIAWAEKMMTWGNILTHRANLLK